MIAEKVLHAAEHVEVFHDCHGDYLSHHMGMAPTPMAFVSPFISFAFKLTASFKWTIPLLKGIESTLLILWPVNPVYWTNYCCNRCFFFFFLNTCLDGNESTVLKYWTKVTFNMKNITQLIILCPLILFRNVTIIIFL